MRLEATPLSQLAVVRSGGGAPQDLSAFTSTGFPFVRAGSLPKLIKGQDESSLEKLEPHVAEEHGLSLFPAGTVLFAKSGMSATKGHVYRLKTPAYVVNHLAALIPHVIEDSEFLLRALQRFSPTTLIKDEAYPSIRLGDIERMKVMVPRDPAGRRRIADILDKADALRSKRRIAFVQLDKLTQSIFLDMFGDPVTNPKGWPVRRLAELLTRPFRNGLSPSHGGQVRAKVLTLSAVTGEEFDPNAWKTSTFKSAPPPGQSVDADDFLICRGNGNIRLVGKGHFPPCRMPGVTFPDTIIAARVSGDSIERAFMEWVWNSTAVRRQIESLARTTNGTFKVNQSMLEGVRFVVPPRPLQRDFARRASIVESRKAVALQAITQLDALFASLQYRAFRGELGETDAATSQHDD